MRRSPKTATTKGCGIFSPPRTTKEKTRDKDISNGTFYHTGLSQPPVYTKDALITKHDSKAQALWAQVFIVARNCSGAQDPLIQGQPCGCVEGPVAPERP